MNDGVFGGANGTVKLAHDVVEGIDDMIVEKELLRGADMDWGLSLVYYKNRLEALPHQEKPIPLSFMLTKVRPPMTM